MKEKFKVLILGAGGMLGSALFRLLPSEDIDVFGTFRGKTDSSQCKINESEKTITCFDALKQTDLDYVIGGVAPNLIINCIGIIKQLNVSNDPLYVIPINSLLPHILAKRVIGTKTRLIHISTDCVFDGKLGLYVETDKPNADDLYGKSKELGEVKDNENVITLRTSLVGHELNSNNSLIDWFLSKEGKIDGFKNAIFSGLTTVEMFKLIRDFVIPNASLAGLYHVSAEPISKYELLKLVKDIYGHNIEIVPNYSVSLDRSLNSEKFRKASGYLPPDWYSMVLELRNYFEKLRENKYVR
ncbi:dTDP-4-dehydrorhamnose reductase family protein [Leptospira levettii]|uniref:dTDP-4-dehydrorhamnose reductase n=1 Tax=Leptospira levettii TaxID=2023178 RepID=A0AAW5VB54_9LEPT|nr:SDR family oxidoreductase [Leptospira levettii]MCW7466225.1 SDR family oxidoreductase [Leptospira levettii]MCW7512250.1 SDR family oxidoreductase [Leptospira levettii]MCW7516258.1 SDR family oxidoreductase [Leptospira levettii]